MRNDLLAPPMRHVMQSGRSDCGVACLAMLTGRPYAECMAIVRSRGAREMVRTWGSGMEDAMLLEALAACGFAVVTADRVIRPYGKQRRPWPPAPFAERHLCLVRFPEHGNMGGHFVVMDGAGTVLDPGRVEPGVLADYPLVDAVYGLYPIDPVRL